MGAGKRHIVHRRRDNVNRQLDIVGGVEIPQREAHRVSAQRAERVAGGEDIGNTRAVVPLPNAAARPPRHHGGEVDRAARRRVGVIRTQDHRHGARGLERIELIDTHVHLAAENARVAGEVGVGGHPVEVGAGVDAGGTQVQRVVSRRGIGEDRRVGDVSVHTGGQPRRAGEIGVAKGNVAAAVPIDDRVIQCP